MAVFTYVGRTAQGATKKGEVAAKTKNEAAAQLRRQRIVVSSLQEKTEGGKFSFGGGVTDRDVVIFTRCADALLPDRATDTAAARLLSGWDGLPLETLLVASTGGLESPFPLRTTRSFAIASRSMLSKVAVTSETRLHDER